MITVMVTFQLPTAMTLAEARTIFLGTAPKYQAVAGLIRKYYVLSQDGKTAGGIYLWKVSAQRSHLAEGVSISEDRVHAIHRAHHAQRF